MDTNFCHVIYAVRSKYVKNTIHDLRQKLLPNILRSLLGGWKLFYCGKIVSAEHIKPLPSHEFTVFPATCRTIKREHQTHSCWHTRRTTVFYGMHISTQI